MHPNHSLIHETGQDSPSSPSISVQKPVLSTKIPKGSPWPLYVLWNIAAVGRGALFCPYLKEGTMAFWNPRYIPEEWNGAEKKCTFPASYYNGYIASYATDFLQVVLIGR
jgi:hypothetical protein